ncbi:SHOCT domain-containing protein [Kitasatospora sp. NBC_01266]|uniref:SHOCT domain-containing protein n=1 Tax=Kitasatospora sp. NBC_01266 TaxID=2903572 RepID=UPI002E34A370|nr:SHOCT domain-containing protein [Kitasatospora sp. NBC_01266]
MTPHRTAWRRWRGPYGPWAHGGPQSPPPAVLGERYARGEIDEDEYRARKATLTEDDGSGGARWPHW